MTVAYGWAPIDKIEKQSDGTVIVEGPIADSGLDRDHQILDEKWLDTAVPKWMAEGGNIRAQHRPDSAAGVALSYQKADGGQHRIAARIVDPVDVQKVEHKVYKGFSVGVKRPEITLDKAAAGGRVIGGDLIEVSLVDRPSNPRTLLTVAKADSADDATLELLETPERVEKVDGVALDAIKQELGDFIQGQFSTIKTELADLVKASAPASDPDVLTKAEVAELLKEREDELTKTFNDALTEAMKPVQALVAKVEAMPTGGGPAITATAAATADDKTARHRALLGKADAATDPNLAAGYREMAADLLKEKN